MNQAVKIQTVSQGLFAVPIKTFNFGDSLHELNENLVSDIIKEVSEDPKGVVKSNFGGWHSQMGLEKKYESFKCLQGIIENCGNIYCEDYGYERDIECFDLWANVNGSGDHNTPHQHNLSALTGVYYPLGFLDDEQKVFNYVEGDVYLQPHSTNGVDGGSLTLFDPNQGKRIHLNTISDEWHNVSYMHLYPTAGVLVLFPTYLVHSVNPFKEEKQKRLSISFEFSYGQGGNSDSKESTEQ
jgi:hypothetical protein